ncbi:ankyrin [Wolfiporia cocos MD-104 SS10]|uniref:Ankyrin n=1 Tax=Wolfiporia cocos (strain MD-104) TaxID=742152 RepID=A0A2H3IV69_WOLCO|nr:ankyrin [Wolfiporia cocos MD-104 SS10]
MSSHVLSPAFEDAAFYLSGASSLSAVSNTIKLELYGLYKYLTVSPTPTTSRPSILDFAGRAKWDAWSNAGQTYGDRAADAESRYLTIARNLGWNEGKEEDVQTVDFSSISQQSKEYGSGGGLGNSVSTMAMLEEQSGSAISDLAISGDTQQLLSFLGAHHEVDVNETDENGYTPLHLACDRGHTKVVELLLSRGADPSIKDPDGLTALELAEISGHDTIMSILKTT